MEGNDRSPGAGKFVAGVTDSRRQGRTMPPFKQPSERAHNPFCSVLFKSPLMIVAWAAKVRAMFGRRTADIAEQKDDSSRVR